MRAQSTSSSVMSRLASSGSSSSPVGVVVCNNHDTDDEHYSYTCKKRKKKKTNKEITSDDCTTRVRCRAAARRVQTSQVCVIREIDVCIARRVEDANRDSERARRSSSEQTIENYTLVDIDAHGDIVGMRSSYGLFSLQFILFATQWRRCVRGPVHACGSVHLQNCIASLLNTRSPRMYQMALCLFFFTSSRRRRRQSRDPAFVYCEFSCLSEDCAHTLIRTMSGSGHSMPTPLQPNTKCKCTSMQ